MEEQKNRQQLSESYGVEDIFTYIYESSICGNRITNIYLEMDKDTRQEFIDWLFNEVMELEGGMVKYIHKIIKQIAA